MFDIIRKMFFLLDKAERQQTYYIFFAMILIGVLDVIGIVSLMPFMAVVTNPDAALHNKNLAAIYHALHFTTPHQLMLFLGIVVFVLCVFGSLYLMFTTWLILRFINMREFTLSKKLLAKYLFQSYPFFLNRNTAELSKNILSEVSAVTNFVLMSAMDLIAKSIVMLFILLLLFYIDPLLAIVMMMVLGGSYAILYISVRTKLSKMSDELVSSNQGRFKASAEALSGIKDIKILHKESVFLQRYAIHAEKHAISKALTDVISLTPRYALEALASGGILFIVMYLLLTKQDISNAVSYIALYAFSFYRLMPSLQQIFISIARLRANRKAMDILYHDLNMTPSHPVSNAEAISPSPFHDKIELSEVTFFYPESKNPALHQLTLSIQAKTSVGFVGATGSGKTTAIDLILGLLTSHSGAIRVDGVILDASNQIQWQKNLGYVPQTIYLTDDTVARNIAFGVPEDKIDMSAVISAAKIADLNDFVMNELQDQYQTLIGERGVRLSGGQRQRIGIARALYHNPAVLILDEATSALDNVTEAAIMEAMQLLANKKTIIIVAHRLSTVMKCDKIYYFEKGGISSSGSYQELYSTHEKFKLMADISHAN